MTESASIKMSNKDIKTSRNITKNSVTLLEVLDRVLEKGVVIDGEIILSVADVDLIYLGLKVLLTSVDKVDRMRRGEIAGEN